MPASLARSTNWRRQQLQPADLLSQAGIPIRRAGEHHHVSHGWVGIDCVFCSPGSGRFLLGLPENGGPIAVCWQCGRHRVGEILYRLGIPSSSWPRWSSPREQVEHTGSYQAPAGLRDLGQPHRKFLEARGLDPDEIIRLWGIRALWTAPQLSWRLWIPITHHGQPVSWTTRSIHPEAQRRYINAPKEHEAIPAKRLLYGADLAGEAIIVVEGPTDAWRLGPGAVATLGIQWTRSQALAIAKYPYRIILFDRSAEAQAQARRLAEFILPFPGETRIMRLDSDDPGSATKEEIEQLRREIQI